MKLRDILKYYQGTLEEFRVWLTPEREAKYRDKVVYIHPDFDKDESGESGWLYVHGAYFTCSATGVVEGDGKYIIINDNKVTLNSRMLLNRQSIGTNAPDDAIVTKGYLDEYTSFESLNQ